MRTIALEEHLSFPELTGRIPHELIARHKIQQAPAEEQLAQQLADITGERLQSMDANGISMQVLSVSGKGADLLSPEDGPAFALDYNDAVAQKIAAMPDRFAAFAHLPTTNPAAAADELERCVKTHGFCGGLINGLTNGEFYDDPKYAPIFERAVQLDVPIYLHPGLPPDGVVDAYYSNLPKQAGTILSIAGWGWHSETAIHVLRLIISGVFDKYPAFKLIIGHMGEMLPVMMARCDTMFKAGEAGINQRSVSQTLKDQVYITTSGIFTQPPFRAALETFGIDHILFSVDYPYAPNEPGRKFLSEVQLSDEDKEKLAHGNAEKLLKLKVEV